jgi:type VI secretion system protein ImpL
LSLAFPLDPQRRSDMNLHVDRLMELLPHPVEIDRRLVAAVRSRLTSEPRVEQVYQRLLREAAQSPRLHPIDLVDVIGSTSLQFATGAAGGAAPRSAIPGVFTRDGFYDFVLPRVPVLVREEQGTDWVLAADQGNDATLQRATRDVMNRYIADYTTNWIGGLNSVAALHFDDLARGLGVLQGLADPQSPLQRLIDVVRDNTDLPPPAPAGTDKATAAAAGATPDIAASLLPIGGVGAVTSAVANAAIGAALGDMPWPGKTIGAPFQPLLQFAGGGAGTGAAVQQTPLGKVRDDFAKLYGTMADIANAPDPRLAANQLLQGRVKDPGSDLFANLRSLSAQAPPPVKGILRDVTGSSWAILLQLTYGYVNDAWQREVVPVCTGALDQRYPLFESAKDDVSLQDFGDFFRPGGIEDGFFTKYIAPLVVDQRSGFAAARLDGLAVPFKPDSLAQFQRARLIRRSFFSGTGAAPGTKFSLRPTYLGSDLLRATLRADAQEIVYRHEPPRAFDLEWPTRSESSTVSVTLTKLDGTDQKVEASGPWALFRLVDAAQIASRGAADKFGFSVGQTPDTQVRYELRAGSVTNPFSLEALRRFRCPDAL